MLSLADCMLPDWDVASPVRALLSLRGGGVSGPPFESLNLGDHVGDDVVAVTCNRARLAQIVGVRPVWLRQVHGRQVLNLRSDVPDGVEADGCVCTEPGLACAIMVADCLPVLWTNVEGTVVAAAHAGWRGLAGRGGQGVLESVHAAYAAAVHKRHPEQTASELAQRTRIWLGPCIGPGAFEVGREVRTAFVESDPAADAMFTASSEGKYLCDLQGLARQRLGRMGVRAMSGNDGSARWCTVSNPSRYFSHRRDQAARGGSGRMAALVWLAR